MLSYDLFPVAILIVPIWSEIYEIQAPDLVRLTMCLHCTQEDFYLKI